jgi:glycine cleavage system aminomethyltransferase T
MPSQELSAALETSKAFVDLSSWRKVDVSGAGALEWLSQLGSADVTDLAPGRARRTVLLEEGGLRTEATVSLAGPSILVLQDSAANPSAVDILTAATGSGAVAIRDRSEALSLFSFPGATVTPDVAGTAFSAPSCVGAGVDVFALAEDHDYLLGSLQHGFVLVTVSDVRTWLEQTPEGS